MSPADVLLGAASLPAAAASGYLALLAVAARRSPAPVGVRGVRFDVIVPAHDEERGIAATVHNLLALDYPRHNFRVIVVADNCRDRTAEVARAAGASVIERENASERGKGYALALAYERSVADGFADAVVVIDADSVASPNLLSAFGARFARGDESVQAEYGVRNADDSWRTRLMRVAFALYHTARSLGRERLALSCGLRGNGMGFSTALLERVPHRAFSVVEDVEYGIALGLAGVRVAYVDEASVMGEMPASEAASRTQRERWEGGRWALLRAHAPSLLRAAVGRRDRIAADLLADLLVPPLTTLVLLVGAGTLVAAFAVLAGVATGVGMAGWLFAATALATYIARGSQVAGTGARALADLLWAPIYGAWKLTLMLRPAVARRGEWIRTERTNDH